MAQQQETLSDRSMVVVLAILLPEDSVLWLCLRSTPRIQSLNCARDTVASEVAAGLSGQWTDGGDDSSIASLTRRPTHLQGSGVCWSVWPALASATEKKIICVDYMYIIIWLSLFNFPYSLNREVLKYP